MLQATLPEIKLALSSKSRDLLSHVISECMQMRGRIDSASFSLGRDFDIWVLPWGREFDMAAILEDRKWLPRGGNLTFTRCPGVGNLTRASLKMSNILKYSVVFR